MEENKKSKGLFWIILTIIAIILGIIGYVVYDNFLKVDKTVPNYDNSTTTTTTQKENLENEIVNFPLKNDTEVISFYLSDLIHNEQVDLTKNFQEEQIIFNSFKYKITCTDYSNEENETIYKGCQRAVIDIDGHKFNEFIWDEGCGHSIYVIIINDFVITQYSVGCDEYCGPIKIYKNKKLIHSISNTTSYYNDTFIYTIKYQNNKLHYLINETENTVTYKTIDLLSDNIEEKEVQKLKTNYSRSVNCEENEELGYIIQ